MIVTLLTDFGTADHFVAAMKGVVLTGCPDARIVDVSHHVPAHDIRAGAFTLLAAYPYFPPGTVHVGVVDPGVGSERRPIVVDAGGHRFVGPDNGLFSWVAEREGDARIYHLDRPRLFRSPVSDTFHGRDVFAPVAAALAAGAPPAEVGSEVGEMVRLDPLAPRRTPDGRLEGTVLHVDRFGNCISSIRREHLTDRMRERGIRVRAGDREVGALRRFFAEADTDPGEVFALWGSAGFLEIAVDRAPAAERLGLRPGSPVAVAPAVD